MNYARHTLCYLHPAAVPLSQHSQSEYDLLQYWLQHNFPLIVTRQAQHLALGQIQLAIPYVKNKKIRAQYTIDQSFIRNTQEPPSLKEIFPSITLQENCRVYGSYCWQYLTKEHYLHPSSDLDVLIFYTNQSLSHLTQLRNKLHEQIKALPLDGEVRFPELGDCSWQELVTKPTPSSFLFKSINLVFLLTRDELHAAYPALFY